MIINTFIHLSLYIHVYVFIMYIFLACMIEICRFMSVYVLVMINTMSIQLSMFVASVIIIIFSIDCYLKTMVFYCISIYNYLTSNLLFIIRINIIDYYLLIVYE